MMPFKQFLVTTVFCGLVTIVLAAAWAMSATPSQAARAAGVIYVDADAGGANTGLSWTDAFTDLQSALITAKAGTEIWVAEGVYKPTTGTDRTKTFRLGNGVALYGGFAGIESSRQERDWATHIVTLSGDIGLTGVMTDNIYHVVTGNSVTRTAVLDGFTITAGNADGGGGGYSYRGGGMLTVGGSPTLRNLVFSGNATNPAGEGGGMSSNNSSNPLLVNIIFRDNSSALGGGLSASYSCPTLINVVFKNNQANAGGGMANSNTTCPAQIINATFEGNLAYNGGGGIDNFASSMALINSILWNNTPSQITHFGSGMSTIRYSLVQDGCPAGVTCDHLLTADPQLVNAAGGDLRLRPGSPAIDAGDNTAVITDTADLDGDGIITETLPFDLAGNPRFLDVAASPDTGIGPAPIVDMGAYEAAFADVGIVKTVTPAFVAPGGRVTYTLAFSNGGSVAAGGIVITDSVPLTLTNVSFASVGVVITATGGVSYTWQVQDLAAGSDGVITLVGTVGPVGSGVFSLTNQAAISAVDDADASDNTSAASSTIDAQAPAVQAVSPPDEAVDASPLAPEVITFTEAIQPASVVFTFTPGVGGQALEWSPSGMVLTVSHAPLASQTRYSVTVVAANDLAGNALTDAPYTWQFTTGGCQIYLPLVLRAG